MRFLTSLALTLFFFSPVLAAPLTLEQALRNTLEHSAQVTQAYWDYQAGITLPLPVYYEAKT